MEWVPETNFCFKQRWGRRVPETNFCFGQRCLKQISVSDKGEAGGCLKQISVKKNYIFFIGKRVGGLLELKRVSIN